jgi:two-component system, chemotaxis family, protein-glutamate methylesterase/glutaminase
VVQDPAEARFAGIPENALSHVAVDHVVPIQEMGPLLIDLVKAPVRMPGKRQIPKSMMIEQKIARMADNSQDIYEIGQPSVYVCPECSGTLFQAREGKLRRYRCRTGHAYSEATLLAERAGATEEALWAAMRALREQGDLLEGRAREQPRGSEESKRWSDLAERARQQANQVRQIIENSGKGVAALKAA